MLRVNCTSQSFRLFNSPRFAGSQPLDKSPRAASIGGIQRSEAVVTDPVQIRAAREKILRGLPLPTMARTPECGGDLLARWRDVTRKMLCHSIHQSQRSRLP